MNILVADSIAEEGIALLSARAQVDVRRGLKSDQLNEVIKDYDALIVRSETRVTAEVIAAGQRLQVVGRAGVGVDNIDVDAATSHGVMVVNAPTSSTIAAVEHTLALMLSLARHIPEANASLKRGVWDRSRFTGTELRGKTLGIIGLGRVGSEVARRARAFEMRLIAYDPFLSQDYARVQGVELMDLDELLRESDFITIHTPLTESTRSLLGERELHLVKPTVRFINAARGGTLDEQALSRALEEGRVAGAGLDVFSEEPALDNVLFKSDKVIVTPHLGASTLEAQASVATEVAEEVLAVLDGQPPRYAVNAPLVLPQALAVLAPFVEVCTAVGNLATQLAEGQMQSTSISYSGEIANYEVTFLKAAVIRGLLAPISDLRVNVVNAHLIAAQRGMKILEQKNTAPEHHFSSLVAVDLTTTEGRTAVAGTQVAGETHIVRIDDYWMDVVPTEDMLFISHGDRPGMIGAVGTVTGRLDVNISFMEVGRKTPRGDAIMVLGLDGPLTEEGVLQIRAVPGISSVKQIRLKLGE